MKADRLALIPSDHVHCMLESLYVDGTTQIVLEPLGLMARLAARVPLPRIHLTRYRGAKACQRLGQAHLMTRSATRSPAASTAGTAGAA